MLDTSLLGRPNLTVGQGSSFDSLRLCLSVSISKGPVESSFGQMRPNRTHDADYNEYNAIWLVDTPKRTLRVAPSNDE